MTSPIDKLTDNEVKAILQKYNGRKIICPKCLHIGKLDFTFGYAICRHSKGNRPAQCIIGSCETEGIFQFLDELIEYVKKKKRKRK